MLHIQNNNVKILHGKVKFRNHIARENITQECYYRESIKQEKFYIRKILHINVKIETVLICDMYSKGNT